MTRVAIGKGFRPQDYKEFDDGKPISMYVKAQRNHIYVNWDNYVPLPRLLSFIREGDKIHMFISKRDLDLFKHGLLDWDMYKKFCATAVYHADMKLNIHLPIIADEESVEFTHAFIKSIDSFPGLTGLCNFIRSDKPTLFKYQDKWIRGHEENYMSVWHDSEVGLYRASKYIPEEGK